MITMMQQKATAAIIIQQSSYSQNLTIRLKKRDSMSIERKNAIIIIYETNFSMCINFVRASANFQLENSDGQIEKLFCK